MDSLRMDTGAGGSETSHLLPGSPRDTYEQIAARAVTTLLVQPYQRHALVAWAVDLLLAADLSVDDYDRGVDLVYELAYGTPASRKGIAARLLGRLPNRRRRGSEGHRAPSQAF